MVKVYMKDGKEEKFDSKDLEKDLKAAGLPERVAEEVAERVEDRVQDGWTWQQVRKETDIELKRLQEDIDRAYSDYKGTTPMTTEERTTRTGEYSTTGTQRSETRVECRPVD